VMAEARRAGLTVSPLIFHPQIPENALGVAVKMVLGITSMALTRPTDLRSTDA
jgi:hypothetical protein